MEKTEFLEQLRQSLSGRIEADKVTDHLRYYEDYINTQLRLGRTENEVLDSLGSPRLIAKTIADTQKDKMKEYREPETAWRSENASNRGKSFRKLPRWGIITAVILIFLFLIWLIFSVLAFLAPILIPFMIVVFLFKFFRDWLH